MIFTIIKPLLFVTMVTGNFTFTCNQPESKAGPTMPTLHDQYEMRLETNIVQSEKTVEVLESYDYTGGQVALTMIRDGQTFKTSMTSKLGNDTKSNQTCTTTKIGGESDNFNVFGFTVKDKDGKVHIASVNDVFRLGAKYNASFVGESEIRGIKVNQWTSCQNSANSHSVFKLDYFFSRPSYISADNQTQVPIRFTITGQAMNHERPGFHNFTHVYEFSIYKPGPIRDRTVFQTPPGVVCAGRNNTVPFPKMVDLYSCEIEVDTPGQRRPFNAKVYFDYDYKLMRLDRFYDKDSPHKYGVGLISITQDYSTGVQYVIDLDEGNCTVEQLDPTFGMSKPGYHPHNVTMSHISDLLDLKNKTFIYQGERVWRGVTVGAWANLTKDVVAEYYFLKSTLNLIGEPAVMVGIYKRNFTASKLESQGKEPPPGQGSSHDQSGESRRTIPAETFIHEFNFHPGHPVREVFDVSVCYEKTANHSVYFTFILNGSYSEDVYGHKSIFIPSVRNAMAKTAGVSPTRITEIQLNQDREDAKKMVITLKLLDKVPIKGDAAHPPKQLSLLEAEKNIMKSAVSGIKVVVKYPKRPPETFIAHSLKVMQSQIADTGTANCSGAIAGAVFGWLLVGCLIGSLVAFCIHVHKRNSTNNQYKRMPTRTDNELSDILATEPAIIQEEKDAPI